MKKIKKKKIRSTCPFRYKLTEIELDRMVFRGVISKMHRDLLIKTSLLRSPSTPAQQRFQMGMNRCGSIILNSINSNGGENFGEPYHFLAEFSHTTTPIVFNTFMKRNRIPAHPFKN